jgi:hypothetical protein
MVTRVRKFRLAGSDAFFEFARATTAAESTKSDKRYFYDKSYQKLAV